MEDCIAIVVADYVTLTTHVSFGVILYEIYSRKDPYEGEHAREVLRAVADKFVQKRPPVPDHMPAEIKVLMLDCLKEDPELRPSFEEIDLRLRRMDTESSPSTAAPKSQVSLFDIFPRHVAEALRDGRQVEAEHKDMVTIFFSDIVGFTDISARLDPWRVANMLDRLYQRFDELSQEFDIFKVRTLQSADVCKIVFRRSVLIFVSFFTTRLKL